MSQKQSSASASPLTTFQKVIRSLIHSRTDSALLFTGEQIRPTITRTPSSITNRPPSRFQKSTNPTLFMLPTPLTRSTVDATTEIYPKPSTTIERHFNCSQKLTSIYYPVTNTVWPWLCMKGHGTEISMTLSSIYKRHWHIREVQQNIMNTIMSLV